MLAAYLLGFFTLPTLMVAAWAGGRVGYKLGLWVWFRFGLHVDFAWSPGLPDDLTLRRDIWTERQVGPFFTGHWYRENPDTQAAEVSRWFGVGRAAGPGLFVLHHRYLDSPHEPAPTPPTDDGEQVTLRRTRPVTDLSGLAMSA